MKRITYVLALLLASVAVLGAAQELTPVEG